jgi:hypothetical protein
MWWASAASRSTSTRREEILERPPLFRHLVERDRRIDCREALRGQVHAGVA